MRDLNTWWSSSSYVALKYRKQADLVYSRVSQASRPGLQQSSRVSRASSPLLAFRFCCTWSPAPCSNSACTHFPWMTTHARVCLFARCAQVLACNQYNAGICCRTRSCLTMVATCCCSAGPSCCCRPPVRCPRPAGGGTPPYISAAGLLVPCHPCAGICGKLGLGRSDQRVCARRAHNHSGK